MCYVDASVSTNVGLIRDNNEDNFYINGIIMEEYQRGNYQVSIRHEYEECIFAVCDGMGGENAGEIASFIAVNELKRFHKNIVNSIESIENLAERMETYVEKTNRFIYEESFDEGSRGMGTTFAGLAVYKNKAIAMNLGDSRLYLLRDNTLTQINNDHTEAERMVEIGLITREEAKTHRGRNLLSRYFGMSYSEGIMEAEVYDETNIQKNDVFLICSDGLSDMLSDYEILDILSVNEDTSFISNLLVNRALRNGGRDNITSMVIRF
ncbi:PP2C family protein-serine/threonine phosphatase [Clostridium cylindrosporum]|uniref:Serine/threonine phosphatase Stp n=1 Tax=Clostridium cylindrosporum DSM 605 TaxID=1121307 RepID=A0A0J8DDN1_CLOCY|nr:protein phosphatase 2C domain-containing protein [Clostridium cylindrosporum]KMT22339.1 serine/threonine phosphatase Stp [Clostridium cylindrosporum DSM 605]